MQETSRALTDDLNDALSLTLPRLRPRIRQILAWYRIPEHEAEDLLQEVLLSLVRRYDKVENLDAWLTCALRYQCRLFWRKYRKRLYHSVDASLLEVLAGAEPRVNERYDQTIDTRVVLGRVSQRCRRILRLRYLRGLTPKELAAELGYQHSSISNIVRRCLAAFCQKLLEPPKTEEPHGT